MIREREIEIVQPDARPKKVTVLEVCGECFVAPPLTIIEMPITDTQKIRFIGRIPEAK
ncbi:MAG TPA: hypothetical protein PLU30_27265 [Verrucomicrobiae bacterium]|nr:hypothetical protein [Verrucomicrobiae bacterium]